MNRSLLEEFHSYFSNKETLNEQEKQFQLQLTEEIPYFIITRVSRDDLEHLKFDISNVSDEKMQKLASKLGDDYCDQLFWTSLGIMAENCLDIPKMGTTLCPICKKQSVEYDTESNTHYCMKCDAEWSDCFVLVEFPEDASYFEQNDIGFPCYNVDDNGARYIQEYDYIKYFGKNPDNIRYFKPIRWPESQQYVFDIFCEAIIADEKGLKEFGPSSFWVPVKQNNSLKLTEIHCQK